MATGFTYGGSTVLSHPLVVEVLLPFLLVFTIVFAILQRTKILGDGKKQIDAIVALVIGLLVVSFGNAVSIIDQLIPVLAVGLVILLVIMLLWGMVFVNEEFKLPDWAKLGTGVLAITAVTIAVIYFSGFWEYFTDVIGSNTGSAVVMNVLIFAVIVGAIAAAFAGAGKPGDKDKKENK